MRFRVVSFCVFECCDQPKHPKPIYTKQGWQNGDFGWKKRLVNGYKRAQRSKKRIWPILTVEPVLEIGSGSEPFLAKIVEPVLEPAVPRGTGTGSTVYRFGTGTGSGSVPRFRF